MIYKNPYIMGFLAAVVVFGVSTSAVGLMPTGLAAPTTEQEKFGTFTIEEATKIMSKSPSTEVQQISVEDNPYLSSVVPVNFGSHSLAEVVKQLNHVSNVDYSQIVRVDGGQWVDPRADIQSVSFSNDHSSDAQLYNIIFDEQWRRDGIVTESSPAIPM